MRQLIRPTLFLVARLGLFLTVAAWVIGQWWEIRIQTQWPTEIRVVTNHPGWVIVSDKDAYTDDASLGSTNNRTLVIGCIDELYTAFEPPTWLDVGHRLPGMFFRQYRNCSSLSVRHWLIVAVFTLFNLGLHLIYRKRPETQPCSS